MLHTFNRILFVASQCLVKQPVKDITRPIDLVLHSDIRAIDRSEFDQQVFPLDLNCSNPFHFHLKNSELKMHCCFGSYLTISLLSVKVAMKMNLIQQYRMERERQQKVK